MDSPFKLLLQKNVSCSVSNEKYLIGVGQSGGFFPDGSRFWKAAGQHFEIYETATCERSFVETLSLNGDSVDIEITCVADVGERLVVIGCKAASLGHIFLFDTAKGRLVSQASIVKKVTALAHVPSDCSFLLPGCAQSDEEAVWLFVGTEEGQVSLMQLPENCSGSSDDATVTYVSKIDLLNDSAVSQKHKKAVSFVEKGPSKCIPVNDASFVEGKFLFLKPSGGHASGPRGVKELGSLPMESVSVTCMKVIPQIGALVVAYSFGGFQFYSLSGLELQYSSNFRADGLPISFLGFQEPENDPRNYCYLWAVFCDPADPYLSVAMMYQLSYDEKHMSEAGFPIFTNLRGESVRFSMDVGKYLTTLGIPDAALCRTVSSFVLTVQQPLDENQMADLEASESLALPTLSLFAMAVETGNDNSDLERQVIVFDINAYYQAQMPSSASVSRNGLNSYIGVFSYGKGAHLLDVYVNPSKVLKYKSCNPTEQHFYPSSLAFDSLLLEAEAVHKVEHLGLQRHMIHNFCCADSSVVVAPTGLCHLAEMYGLLPPDQPSLLSSGDTLPIMVYRECILGILLEYGCDFPLKHLIKALSAGSDFDDLTLCDLMNWMWGKVSALKTNNDVLCVPLFNMSVDMVETVTLESLHKNSAQLRLLLSLFEVMDSCGSNSKTDENFLLALRQRAKATKLITEHLEVLLWFVHSGLLPEAEHREPGAGQEDDSEDLPNSRLPYPIAKLRGFYASRRESLAEGSSADPQKVLLIDNFLEDLGEQVVSVWGSEQTNPYPPPSLQSLLEIYLLDGALKLKHRVVQYLLMDVAAALSEERSPDVLDMLQQFPLAVSLNQAVSKATVAYWMMDHRKYEDALSYLLHPTVRYPDIGLKDYRSIIKLMIYDNEPKRALRFVSLRPCGEPEPEDRLMHLRLLLLNGFVGDAFMYQRQKRTRENGEWLLMNMFTACAEKGRLDLMMNKPFDSFEEEAFIKFLKAWENPRGLDLLLAFYLQRGRFADAVAFQKKLKAQNMSNPTRDALVTAYMKALPPLTVKLTKACSSLKPAVLAATGKAYPKPLSTIVKPSTVRVTTNADKYMNDVLEGTRQVLLATPTPNRKRKLDQEERIPFLKSIHFNDDAQHSPVSFARKIPVKEPAAPPSAKKLRISEAASNRFDDSILAPDIRAVLRTPTLQRVHAQRRSRAAALPPSSILKPRNDSFSEDTTVSRSKHLRFSTLPPVIFQSPEASERSCQSTASTSVDMTAAVTANIFEQEPTSTQMDITAMGGHVRKAIEETRDWALREIQKEQVSFLHDMEAVKPPQVMDELTSVGMEMTKVAPGQLVLESTVSDTESFHSLDGSSGTRSRLDLGSSFTDTSMIVSKVIKEGQESANKWKGFFQRYGKDEPSSEGAAAVGTVPEPEKFVRKDDIPSDAFSLAISAYNRRHTTVQETEMDETNVGTLPSRILLPVDQAISQLSTSHEISLGADVFLEDENSHNQDITTFQEAGMEETIAGTQLAEIQPTAKHGVEVPNFARKSVSSLSTDAFWSRRQTTFQQTEMEETNVWKPGGILPGFDVEPDLTVKAPDASPVDPVLNAILSFKRRQTILQETDMEETHIFSNAIKRGPTDKAPDAHDSLAPVVNQSEIYTSGSVRDTVFQVAATDEAHMSPSPSSAVIFSSEGTPASLYGAPIVHQSTAHIAEESEARSSMSEKDTDFQDAPMEETRVGRTEDAPNFITGREFTPELTYEDVLVEESVGAAADQSKIDTSEDAGHTVFQEIGMEETRVLKLPFPSPIEIIYRESIPEPAYEFSPGEEAVLRIADRSETYSSKGAWQSVFQEMTPEEPCVEHFLFASAIDVSIREPACRASPRQEPIANVVDLLENQTSENNRAIVFQGNEEDEMCLELSPDASPIVISCMESSSEPTYDVDRPDIQASEGAQDITVDGLAAGETHVEKLAFTSPIDVTSRDSTPEALAAGGPSRHEMERSDIDGSYIHHGTVFHEMAMEETKVIDMPCVISSKNLELEVLVDEPRTTLVSEKVDTDNFEIGMHSIYEATGMEETEFRRTYPVLPDTSSSVNLTQEGSSKVGQDLGQQRKLDVSDSEGPGQSGFQQPEKEEVSVETLPEESVISELKETISESAIDLDRSEVGRDSIYEATRMEETELRRSSPILPDTSSSRNLTQESSLEGQDLREPTMLNIPDSEGQRQSAFEETEKGEIINETLPEESVISEPRETSSETTTLEDSLASGGAGSGAKRWGRRSKVPSSPKVSFAKSMAKYRRLSQIVIPQSPEEERVFLPTPKPRKTRSVFRAFKDDWPSSDEDTEENKKPTKPSPEAEADRLLSTPSNGTEPSHSGAADSFTGELLLTSDSVETSTPSATFVSAISTQPDVATATASDMKEVEEAMCLEVSLGEDHVLSTPIDLPPVNPSEKLDVESIGKASEIETSSAEEVSMGVDQPSPEVERQETDTEKSSTTDAMNTSDVPEREVTVSVPEDEHVSQTPMPSQKEEMEQSATPLPQADTVHLPISPTGEMEESQPGANEIAEAIVEEILSAAASVDITTTSTTSVSVAVVQTELTDITTPRTEEVKEDFTLEISSVGDNHVSSPEDLPQVNQTLVNVAANATKDSLEVTDKASQEAKSKERRSVRSTVIDQSELSEEIAPEVHSQSKPKRKSVSESIAAQPTKRMRTRRLSNQRDIETSEESGKAKEIELPETPPDVDQVKKPSRRQTPSKKAALSEEVNVTPSRTRRARSISSQEPASPEPLSLSMTLRSRSRMSVSPDLFADHEGRSQSAEPTRPRRSMRASSAEPAVPSELPPSTPRSTRKRAEKLEEVKATDSASEVSDDALPKRRIGRPRSLAASSHPDEIEEAEEKPVEKRGKRRSRVSAAVGLSTIHEATTEEPPVSKTTEEPKKKRVSRKKSSVGSTDDGETGARPKRRISVATALKTLRETDSDSEEEAAALKKPVLLMKPRSRLTRKRTDK